jgi:large subunit ribosomal protein L10
MRKAGAQFRVAKNRLAKRAAEGTPYAGVIELFKGPTALAFSADAVSAAKVAAAFAKKNDKLQLIGGGLAGSLLDPAAVRALAELPSLEELRGKLVGLLQAPAARLIAVLQAPGAQVARCLGARGEQAGA